MTSDDFRTVFSMVCLYERRLPGFLDNLLELNELLLQLSDEEPEKLDLYVDKFAEKFKVDRSAILDPLKGETPWTALS